MYNSTLSLAWALDAVRGQDQAPAPLHSAKTQYKLFRWFDGPQGRSRRVRKFSPPPEFDSRTVPLEPFRFLPVVFHAVEIVSGWYLQERTQ
jgi:hypothetical protein